jgi:DNA-binding MarR family transcriptional regulator
MTKPTAAEVASMALALFTVKASLDRAARRSKGASALTVLQLLEERAGLRPSQIASALQVHPSQVTRQVQELAEDGLVTVQANEADRRSCLVSLTQEGRAEAERLRTIGLARFATFVSKWDAGEVRELTRLLNKLEASKAGVGEQERRRGQPSWRTRP